MLSGTRQRAESQVTDPAQVAARSAGRRSAEHALDHRAVAIDHRGPCQFLSPAATPISQQLPQRAIAQQFLEPRRNLPGIGRIDQPSGDTIPNCIDNPRDPSSQDGQAVSPGFDEHNSEPLAGSNPGRLTTEEAEHVCRLEYPAEFVVVHSTRKVDAVLETSSLRFSLEVVA